MIASVPVASSDGLSCRSVHHLGDALAPMVPRERLAEPDPALCLAFACHPLGDHPQAALLTPQAVSIATCRPVTLTRPPSLLRAVLGNVQASHPVRKIYRAHHAKSFSTEPRERPVFETMSSIDMPAFACSRDHRVLLFTRSQPFALLALCGCQRPGIDWTGAHRLPVSRPWTGAPRREMRRWRSPSDATGPRPGRHWGDHRRRLFVAAPRSRAMTAMDRMYGPATRPLSPSSRSGSRSTIQRRSRSQTIAPRTATALPRAIIDADHTRCGRLRWGVAANHAEQGVIADRKHEPMGKALTRLDRRVPSRDDARAPQAARSDARTDARVLPKSAVLRISCDGNPLSDTRTVSLKSRRAPLAPDRASPRAVVDIGYERSEILHHTQGKVAVFPAGCARSAALWSSLSIPSMISPHGTSVITRLMTTLPSRFAANVPVEMHQD